MKTKNKPAKAPADPVKAILDKEQGRIRDLDAACTVVWVRDGVIAEAALFQGLHYSMAKTLANGLNESNAGKDRTAVVLTMAVVKSLEEHVTGSFFDINDLT